MSSSGEHGADHTHKGNAVAALGMMLMYTGLAISMVGGIWLLILAFQESLLWGVGCLLIPPAALVFVILHWQEAKNPFLIQLGGAVLYIVGIVMAGSSIEV